MSCIVHLLLFLKKRCKVTKSRAQNKETRFFFCRGGVNSPIFWQSYEKSLSDLVFRSFHYIFASKLQQTIEAFEFLIGLE
jgi:hypothetical protein